jgi:hypothetical protein
VIADDPIDGIGRDGLGWSSKNWFFCAHYIIQPVYRAAERKVNARLTSLIK